MHPDLKEILFAEADIQSRIRELAAEIERDYAGKNLLLIGILKGAIIFLSDLSRSISMHHELDLVGASSYSGTQSTGQVRITMDIEISLHNRDVLLIEDIYDTGRTLNKLYKMIELREPNSVEICCLLEKPEMHMTDVAVKYVGFKIPNVFVVGYGLDYEERYRNLRDIGILKESIYKEP